MNRLKLSEICNINAGGTPARSKKEYWNHGKIPWCKISDFSGKYIEKVEENITEEGLNNSSAKLFKKGTILYTIFATIGEVAILNIESTTNQAIAGIEIKNNGVELEYLYYFLKSLKYIMLNKSRGVAQNNINLSILRNTEIYIPDKTIQKAIAEKLDNVEKIIYKKNEQLKELNNLIKSQFVEMFGDPIQNDKKWDTDLINNVAPSQNYKGSFEDKVWLLNLDMVESNSGRIIGYVYENINNIGNSTCTFNEENILYSKLRPYLNKVVIPSQKGYATSELVPLKPNKDKLNRYFLAYLLRSEQFVQYISEKVAGAKMPRVSMDMFRKFNLILPPIELQNKFAEFVKQIDKQKFEIENSLKEMQKLYECLMEKYFG